MNLSDPHNVSDHASVALAGAPGHLAPWVPWLAIHAHAFIAAVSSVGEVRFVSPQVGRVLGFTPQEVIGESAFAHIDRHDVRTVQEQCRAGATRIVCRHRHKDGSWRWLEATLQPTDAEEGSTRGVFVRDITAQKQIEEERDRLQLELNRISKLAALGTIAGGVVHDFNNLLTAIMAYTSYAHAETEQPEVAESLGQVLRASERARQLTRQILAFSREQAHVPKPVELAPIVQEAVALLRPMVPANITVNTEISSDSALVLADACQIHQVVLNLCGNAVDAMRPSAGQVSIRLQRVSAEAWAPEAPLGGARVEALCLRVADNGRGMDAATQQHIFEPFFTTKALGQGTGLGLAVVQRIVRDHQASIRVSSTPGQGTVFEVFFPILKDVPVTARSADHEPPVSANPLHTLT